VDYSISLKSYTELTHDNRSAVKVQGQKVKGQGHIINNLAAVARFRSDFDHVTLDVPRTFKVNGSTVKVIA